MPDYLKKDNVLDLTTTLDNNIIPIVIWVWVNPEIVYDGTKLGLVYSSSTWSSGWKFDLDHDQEPDVPASSREMGIMRPEKYMASYKSK